MKLRFLVLAIVLLLLSTGTVFAAKFFGGETVYVENPLGDDVYIAGNQVTIERSISGDLVVASGNVTVYGDIGGDLIALAGKVQVNGNVADDVRIMSGTVVLNGNVGDDVLIAGGSVDISKNATIGDDLLVTSGFLTIDGTVHGNVKGGVSTMILRGWIDKNVDMTIEGRLNVLPSARVGGDLKYFAVNRAKIPAGVVQGKIDFNEFQAGQTIKGRLGMYLSKGFLIYQLFSFLGALLVGFVLLWIFGGEFKKVVHTVRDMPLKMVGMGFVILLAGTVSVIVLMMTVVGIPLALAFGVIFAAMLYFSKLYASVLLGSLFFKIEKLKFWGLFGVLALGLFLYTLIGLIPFIGWIVALVFFLAAFGGLATNRWRLLKFMQAKKQI